MNSKKNNLNEDKNIIKTSLDKSQQKSNNDCNISKQK